MIELQRGKRYAVELYPGIAFRFVGQATYLDDEGEEVEHDMVRMVMVGDDVEHWLDPEYVTELADDAYCTECGQVGCGWGVNAA